MPSSGNWLSRVSSSSRKLLMGPGGRYITMIYRLMGWVISTEWYSKAEGDRLVRGNTENVEEGEISKPVPPPRPDGREVCEKEKEDERAAGVAVFSGVIHVLVSAKN